MALDSCLEMDENLHAWWIHDHIHLLILEETHGCTSCHWDPWSPWSVFVGYGLNAHECIYHFIDIFVKYSRWIHHNFIKRKHVPKNLFFTCSNHVISYLFVIAIDCDPLLLAFKPISNVCVVSKSHHTYGMFFFKI